MICFLFLLMAGDGPAYDPVKAKFNYIMHCQGCHRADAAGLGDEVPNMKDFVGKFTHFDEGRKFLIQVPGVANAPISDKELADLLNWMLDTYSKNELPEDFQPYTEAEVAPLRRIPRNDVIEHRKKLVAVINQMSRGDR